MQKIRKLAQEIEESVNKFSNVKKDTLTEDIAKQIGEFVGVDWEKSEFPPSQLYKGMLVEYEHGTISPETNITDDDPIMTAKIALAHLNERADYYVKLAQMEASSIEKVAKDDMTFVELRKNLVPKLEKYLIDTERLIKEKNWGKAHEEISFAISLFFKLKNKIDTFWNIPKKASVIIPKIKFKD
jgi:hypothetical protein